MPAAPAVLAVSAGAVAPPYLRIVLWFRHIRAMSERASGSALLGVFRPGSPEGNGGFGASAAIRRPSKDQAPVEGSHSTMVYGAGSYHHIAGNTLQPPRVRDFY